MKTWHWIVAAAAVLILVGYGCSAGWGPRACASVEALAAAQVPAALKWWTIEGRPDEVFLYRGNVLVGTYDYRDGFYRLAYTGTPGRKAKAPIPPPFGKTAEGGPSHTFGMVESSAGVETRFSLNGETVTRGAAQELLGANIVDDSKHGHLTYIDADAGRRKAMGERYAALRSSKPTGADIRWQSYDPNKPQSRAMLEPNALDTDKQFLATGRVLVAQAANTNKDGSSKADVWYGDITDAQLIEAIRKISPAWDPNKPVLPSLPSLPSLPWDWIILGMIGVGVVVLASKNTSP